MWTRQERQDWYTLTNRGRETLTIPSTTCNLMGAPNSLFPSFTLTVSPEPSSNYSPPSVEG